MQLITLEYVDVLDNKTKTLQFSKDLLDENINRNSLFALRVDGKSMQPLILDKSLIVADLSNKKFENEAIFVIYKDGKFWVKKAFKEKNKRCFISINEKFSHLKYSFDEVRIIAKVVLCFTKL